MSMQDYNSLKKEAKKSYLKGNYDVALNILLQLKKSKPHDIEVLNDIGIVLLAMGKTNESLDFFLSAHKIDPANENTQKNIEAISHHKILSDDQIERINHLHRLSSTKKQQILNDHKRILCEAIDLQKKGNLYKAWNLCESIINDNPENREALHIGAKILQQIGDNQNAYTLARYSLKERPYPQYYHTFADIAWSLGKKEESDHHRKKANILKKIQLTAMKAVDAAKSMQYGTLSVNEFEKLLIESKDNLNIPGWNNISFYILSHALMARENYVNTYNTRLKAELDSRGWSKKMQLYQYWFNSVNFLRKVENAEISIVMISYRLHENTFQCLKELRKQLNGSGEIIFVNNGCLDKEFNLLMPYIDTYINLNGNSGVCISRNIGALFSHSPVLLFIEDDGIPDQNLVRAHLDVYKKYDAVIARGVYLCRKSTSPNHYYLGPRLQTAMCNKEGNCSILSDVFYRVDGWSDYLFYGSEGRELGFRLVKNGYGHEKHLYTPDAVLYHEYIRNPSHMEEKWLKIRASWLLMHAMYPEEYEDYLQQWSHIRQGIVKVEPVIKKRAMHFST